MRKPMTFLTAVIVMGTGGCAEYDPPPEPTMVLPEGGAFSEGDIVEIRFSEPIDPSTLMFRVYPNERDIENEIPASVSPLVNECASGTCGDLTVELSENRKSVDLIFEGELGTPGRPMVVELVEGLEDEDGNDTGTEHRWDIQFRSTGRTNENPVEFDDGVYILLANIEKPLPTVLTLISDVRVLDDGRFALAGGEGDEINGDAKNTQNPRNLVIDETNQGWAAQVTGFVSVTDDGKRLLESDPVDLNLPVGPLLIQMTQVRLFADIIKNPETGKDKLDGTLSFEKVILKNGERTSETDGGSVALVAEFVPPDLVPEGTPRVCGDSCGLVVAGYCEVPEDFPPEGFCGE